MIKELLAMTMLFNSTVGIIPNDGYLSSAVKLGEKTISLKKRHEIQTVNVVFKNNILLTLKYLSNEYQRNDTPDWNQINKAFNYEFALQPNEMFAFHEDTFLEFKKKTVKSTAAHFNYEDGFQSDGYLYGDGVCHLASLLYWVAKNAGLDAIAPTNHDFMPIPQIPKEFGVSIYFQPGQTNANAQQNLYIANNKNSVVRFKIIYDGENLTAEIWQDN